MTRQRGLALGALIIGVLVLALIVGLLAGNITRTNKQLLATERTLKYCERETSAGKTNSDSGQSTIAYAVFDKKLNPQQRSDFEAFDLLPKISFCFSSLHNEKSSGKAILIVNGSSGQARRFGRAISLYLSSSDHFSTVKDN
jgi:hypothetical protein